MADARQAEIVRQTRETDIRLTLDLDGSGRADNRTGVGFLDHMLDLFAKHALFDLTVSCQGDLHVDAHHTTEDIGICLGQAIDKALGDRAGIRRYGHAILPITPVLGYYLPVRLARRRDIRQIRSAVSDGVISPELQTYLALRAMQHLSVEGVAHVGGGPDTAASERTRRLALAELARLGIVAPTPRA